MVEDLPDWLPTDTCAVGVTIYAGDYTASAVRPIVDTSLIWLNRPDRPEHGPIARMVIAALPSPHQLEESDCGIRPRVA